MAGAPGSDKHSVQGVDVAHASRCASRTLKSARQRQSAQHSVVLCVPAGAARPFTSRTLTILAADEPAEQC